MTPVEAMNAAEEIVMAIEATSNGLHDSREWFVERDDGTYPIDELQDRITSILRKIDA